MNYYNIVDKISCGDNINNMSLRVTFYVRVSTSSDVQLNSLDNQKNYYEKYIKSNKKWTIVEGYIDEGISGTRALKRPSFMKMINDAKNGKFDLIITKDVSRFARDIEDSVHYTRKLKEYGVGVLFENQLLNTFDPNSELTLNILYNLAQEESKKISSSVKFGFRKAIDNGKVLGSSNITGYKKDKCRLIIVKEESKFVKRVFELYATGNYGLYKLSKVLSEEGYFNKKGNIYDKDSLKRIIENPKYKGYYRSKTFEVLDYRTKKRKKNNIKDQIIYKCTNGSIPKIVSEELWNKANEILNERKSKYKNNSNHFSGSLKYAFSSKIYCNEHNTSFGRRSNRLIKTWSCNKYLQGRISSCASPIIPEIDLYNIMSNIFKKIIINKSEIINELLAMYNSVDKRSEYKDDLYIIENEINLIESKKNMVLDLVYSNVIDYSSLKFQFESFNNKIERLLDNKRKIIKQIKLLDICKSNDLKDYIEKEINEGSLNDFIRMFIKKIIVSKINNDRNNIKLDIYLSLLNQDDIDCSNLLINNEKIIGINNKNNFIYNVFVDYL